MPRGIDIGDVLRPLGEKPLQAYFGQGLHTLGLLSWLLDQTGTADVWVSSYSTSEAFLNGFILLRQRGLVRNSTILLDMRAARKTLRLERLLCSAFGHVLLGQNHSKLLLIRNWRHSVSVVTSQNQTYGARAESTIISTDHGVFDCLMRQYLDQLDGGAVEIDLENGRGIITEDRGAGYAVAHSTADWLYT